MPLRLFTVLLVTAFALSAQSADLVADLGPLNAAERVAAREPLRTGERSLRKTGIHRSLAHVALGPNSRIRSMGAAGLRLHATGFDAADGTLLIRGAQGETAYTGRGPNEDGEFWSSTVFGEELVTEFLPGPSGAALRWSVPEVTHSFGLEGYAGGDTGSNTAQPLRCALDISCHADWSESAQAVAMFYFEVQGGQASCSGALVRTKSGSGVPYFLTAAHCISDEQTARSVETFWNYQTSACNGKAPDLKSAVRVATAGARYVVSKDTLNGDYSMMVLNAIPAVARFADFDPRELELGQPITSISHPLGSYKRAAFGSVYTDYWDFGAAAASFPQQLYYKILFTQGATHPGSSGSPLFSKPNTISGMLSHGPEFGGIDICAQNPRVDGYAKLSLAWPDLQKYLDDPAPSTLTVSPAQVTLTVRNGAAVDGLRRTLVVNSTSSQPVAVSVSAGDPWVQVVRALGTARAGAPFTTELVFLPEYFQNRSGLLRTRLEVVSGNNGRVVPVDADVIVLPSDVAVQGKALTLEGQDDCRYRVELSLSERGGIATNLTALRLNGEDYSDRIGEWFGSAQLGAKGTLRASLKVCWPGQLDSFRITIAGRDAGSNRAWSNSTLIDF